jgi:hypothetical protein
MDKLEEGTIKAILKEIGELKEAEEKASMEGVTKAMMEAMAITLASYVSTGKIEYDVFKKLQTKMDAYDKVANPQPEQAE